MPRSSKQHMSSSILERSDRTRVREQTPTSSCCMSFDFLTTSSLQHLVGRSNLPSPTILVQNAVWIEAHYNKSMREDDQAKVDHKPWEVRSSPSSSQSLTVKIHPADQQDMQVDASTTITGYIADTSSSGSESGSEAASSIRCRDESKLGLVIDVPRTRKQHDVVLEHHSCFVPAGRSSTKRRHSRKKKKRNNDGYYKRRKTGTNTSLLLKLLKPAPSPIHPEIDFSLTHHIAVRNSLICPNTDVILQGAISSPGSNRTAPRFTNGITVDECAVAVPALSNAVLRYFSDLQRELPSTSGFSLTVNGSSYRSGKEINEESTRKKLQSESDQELGKSQGSPGPEVVSSTKAQVISDAASFSDEPIMLENALDITDTPRLLLEAASPHRVIHINAAFSRNILATANGRRFSSDAQKWMENQNKPQTILSQNRSLQEAIEQIIPENASIPLTCYPVIAAGSVTHYLVEATTRKTPITKKARHNHDRVEHNHHKSDQGKAKGTPNSLRLDTMKLYNPFETVG